MNQQHTRTLGLIEIKAETVPQWKKWGARLMNDLKTEALETLTEEGLTQEHVFLLEFNDKHFLGFFTEGNKLPTNLKREINQKHRTLLDESRIRKISGSLIYSLKKDE